MNQCMHYRKTIHRTIGKKFCNNESKSCMSKYQKQKRKLKYKSHK